VTHCVSRSTLGESLVVAAIACAGAAALLIASCAAAVQLTGSADEVRYTFRLSFAGVERTPGEAAAIALQNGRLAAAALLGTFAVRRLPGPARSLVDMVLGAVFVVNVAAIGLALGAYGERLLVATAPHTPIELAALSLSGGTYISARRRRLPPHALACVVGVTAVLLAGAAAAETYVSGGAS